NVGSRMTATAPGKKVTGTANASRPAIVTAPRCDLTQSRKGAPNASLMRIRPCGDWVNIAVGRSSRHACAPHDAGRLAQGPERDRYRRARAARSSCLERQARLTTVARRELAPHVCETYAGTAACRRTEACTVVED